MIDIKYEDDGTLPDALRPQLIARIPKYGNSVEIHLLLVEVRPGVRDYCLRDYLVAERTYVGGFMIPLPVAPELAKQLRMSRTPRKRTRRR